jgi:hypothetical protein
MFFLIDREKQDKVLLISHSIFNQIQANFNQFFLIIYFIYIDLQSIPFEPAITVLIKWQSSYLLAFLFSQKLKISQFSF